uniref:SUZ RNA-binding domain-containing n=1 Tax=Anopheles culicifacies TaxID=139723 RepID=A0A182LTL4_9DIPT
MSTKKQEIADSWEDIDEEQLANAITILKNCTSLDEDKADSTKSTATSGNTARQNSLPQMLEEELRPKMVARPMQILKRPQTSGSSEGKPGAADSKPKTQIKSLDQRKQAYAEARLRILGSAHDDEEAETKKTTTTTNGHRVNNVNNNIGYSGNTSSNANNASGSGGGGGGGVGGDGMAGNSANNNSNHMYRFHPPYRQQAPIGTFPPGMQNGPLGRAQGAPVVYYPPTSNHHHHHPHHPMHNTHPLHHSHHTFSPKPHHQQHIHPQQPHQQQPPSSHPYQQHFAQHLNHQQPGGRDAMWYVGMRNGFGYGEGMGPLLGHAPPGAIPNHAIPFNGASSGAGGGGGGGGGGTTFGKPNTHGSSSGSNIVSNQHVLRLPAGPDGSQGFSMRR